VKLYFLDDGTGALVQSPAALSLEQWDGGQWQDVSGSRTDAGPVPGHRPTVFRFRSTLLTSKLKVIMTAKPGASVGMTEFEAWGHANLPLDQPAAPKDDLALNAVASASFTNRGDRVEAINDGQIDMQGGSRWTAYSSPNSTDWVQLTFPKPVAVSRIVLCPWADGGGVRIPKSCEVQYWERSDWRSFQSNASNPFVPVANVPNVVDIEKVITSKIRLTFVSDGPGRPGVSELLVFEK
jgi:hypothetical protein